MARGGDLRSFSCDSDGLSSSHRRCDNERQELAWPFGRKIPLVFGFCHSSDRAMHCDCRGIHTALDGAWVRGAGGVGAYSASFCAASFGVTYHVMAVRPKLCCVRLALCDAYRIVNSFDFKHVVLLMLLSVLFVHPTAERSRH